MTLFEMGILGGVGAGIGYAWGGSFSSTAGGAIAGVGSTVASIGGKGLWDNYRNVRPMGNQSRKTGVGMLLGGGLSTGLGLNMMSSNKSRR